MTLRAQPIAGDTSTSLGVEMIRSFGSRVGVCLALFLGFLLSSPLVGADIPYPKRPPNTTDLERMRGGTLSVAANLAKNKQLIGDLAKYLAHRLVHPPFNGEELKIKPPIHEDLDTLLVEVDKWTGWPNPRQPPNEMQIEYAKELGSQLEFEIMYVMSETVKPLERVNAARMLATVGKLPCESLATAYLKIIKETKYPLEIKFFAFQGLRHLLAIPFDARTPNVHFIRDGLKQAEIATELDKFILMKHGPGVPPSEVLVIQYVRREAIRAMAMFKNSIVTKGIDVLAKPVWSLLRVASNDKIVKTTDAALPGFGYSTMERIEAVIGICSMIPDKNMNLDLVAYIVNDAVRDIMETQANERVQYQKDARNKPLVPWKITAMRLTEAMRIWDANAKKLPPARSPSSVSQLADQAIPSCFSRLEADGVLAQPDNRPFDNWRRDRKPKSTTVIQEDETTAVLAYWQ